MPASVVLEAHAHCVGTEVPFGDQTERVRPLTPRNQARCFIGNGFGVHRARLEGFVARRAQLRYCCNIAPGGNAMDAHGQLEYATATGNDYVVHEQTYRRFLTLTKSAIAVIVGILILMAIFLV